MKKVIFPFVIFILIAVEISAQKIYPQILSSSGSSYQTNTMTIDWTLGELSITTITGPSSMITQGFHQPKYIITAVDVLSETAGKILVYPNPTSDEVNMKMTFDKTLSVRVRLVDSEGRLLWYEKYTGQNMIERAFFGNLPNGNYFLNFTTDGNISKQTFKIQKIN